MDIVEITTIEPIEVIDKYNTYHDELGRFASADGKGGGAQPTGLSRADRENYQQTLKNIEDEIRYNKYETVVVISPKGEILHRERGERNITYLPPASETKSWEGATITHNHPDGVISGFDLLLAFNSKAKELRAIYPDGHTEILTRKSTDFSQSRLHKFVDDYGTFIKSTKNKLLSGKKILDAAKKRITIREALAELNRELRRETNLWLRDHAPYVGYKFTWKRGQGDGL